MERYSVTTDGSERVKIAFFTDTYLPNIDGVVVAILNTRRMLEKLGHEVFIFAPEEIGKTNTSGTLGIPDDKVFHYPAIPFLPYPQYKLALSAHGARQVIKENNIDIIHSHGMGPMGFAAIYCAKRLNLPLIGTLHTNIQEATHYLWKYKTGKQLFNRVAKSIAWKYLKAYYNECNKTIVPSEYMAKLCRRHGIKNVAVLSNGIDLSRFKPPNTAPKKISNRTQGKKNIVALYVGRLVREKNLDVMIKAARYVEKKNPHIRFVIVGGGPASDYYKELTTRYRVAHLFTFVGPVNIEETINYYHNADIFVFPSVFETQGLSAIEAMACGLPVAGARALAIPDLVKDGYNGYLFRPKDVKGCADAILRTIAQRNKLRKNAIKTAQEHSLDKCVNALTEIYSTVCHEHQHKHTGWEKWFDSFFRI